MDQIANKFDLATRGTRPLAARIFINSLARVSIRLGILKEDVDYHLIRASMVILFFLFGYQKWFQYEAQVLIPYISNGPLIFWLYPVFGIRGATRFLGLSEWTFGMLLFLGFWNKKLGILGALGSCVTFISTVTIIKDIVLLSVSFYLLRQDMARTLFASTQYHDTGGWAPSR